MRKRMLVAVSILSLATGGLLMPALGQQAPLAAPLPPAGGGPAAAAAAASYEVPWDKLPQGERGEGVPALYVRQGYKVTVASDPIPNGVRQGRTGQAAEARFMAMDDNGNLFVSQPTAGRIVSLKDDGTGKYVTNPTPLVEGKITVHGMFFKDGWLWYTQSKAVYKVKLTKDGKADGEAVTVLSDLPGVEKADGGHWWRSILVVADGFFTEVGDPQNASDQTATERSKIWKYSLDGKTRELWCSGVRNTEKLQLRPGTDELWGCDHGSDNFAANLKETAQNQPVTNNYPPDEFNHYVKDGFYGHPFIVGAGLPRPEYANRADILAIAANTIDPAWMVGPHYANNGWTFVNKDSGVAHRGDVLIACHGSWNSTLKEGYRIQKVLFDQQTGQPYGAIQLVGTLSPDHKNTLARAVDVLEMADGSFLFSDDWNNRIWRLSAAKGQTEPK